MTITRFENPPLPLRVSAPPGRPHAVHIGPRDEQARAPASPTPHMTAIAARHREHVRALAVDFRQAFLHATAAERDDLRKLHAAVLSREISVADAHRSVKALRGIQARGRQAA